MTDFLAVDTSSKYLTVLAKKGSNAVCRHLPECAMRHSVVLMDEVQCALTQASLDLSECGFLAAVTGPGSFTGIRIGLSTIKGMCAALKKPGIGVTSFQLVAYNVNSPVPFGVAIDAMHGNFYFASFTPEYAADIQPCYLSAEQVESLSLPLYGFEDLPLKNYTRLNAGDCLHAAVMRAAESGGGVLNALYVRKSQAEEARLANS